MHKRKSVLKSGIQCTAFKDENEMRVEKETEKMREDWQAGVEGDGGDKSSDW